MTATGGAAAAADAPAGRAARAREIASSASDAEQGGLLAALFPNGRTLAIEFVVIAGLIALTAFLVYHFTTQTIANRRPLGGRNVAVAAITGDQTQMSFAARGGSSWFGASNDSSREVLDVYATGDGGATWKRTDGPPVPGSCALGDPQVAARPGGGEVLAFLAAPECGSALSLTPYLVVSTRSGPTGRWSPLHRLARPAWAYGFDDNPVLASRGDDLYLAWTRSLSKVLATTVVSSSHDGGRTWSPPVVVSRALDRPHLPTIAVGGDGSVYLAGIDARLGLWVTRSRDGGRTFARPTRAAALPGNPAAGCALIGDPAQPLPKEQRACEGPDPTLLATRRGRVVIVYSAFGADRTSDVHAVLLDAGLAPVRDTTVNPPDRGATQQFAPAAAADAHTGTLWACWYDTTFDPHAHRAWYTCSASHDGRTWSAPVAAASKPSAAADVYGAIAGLGLRSAVVASRGVAHAFWADSRSYVTGEDVETAAIPERSAFAAR